ncbi:MAG: AMP-binding protein [Gammaproteobacteria bacterium]
MKNLYSVLKSSVEEHGPHLALTFCQRYRTSYWSYRDLDRHVTRIAARLEAQKVGKGDRVLLFGGNSPYWVAGFFAILARGAIVVPLNPQSTPDQLKSIIVSSQPKLLLRTHFSLWQGPRIESELLEDAPDSDLAPTGFPGLDTEPDELAQIVYTSGTTGAPKGIMLTHGNLLAGLKSLPPAVPLQQKNVVMSILPLFHLYGQMAGMLYPLQQGASITYLPSLSSRVIRKTLNRTPAEFLVTVPEFLKTMMDRLDEKLEKWPDWLRYLMRGRIRKKISKTLHTLVSGGAPLPPELELKWRALGFEVLQGYGLTETSPMISINTPSAHRVGSVGKPLPGVQVRISSDGEIQVKGANVMKGYFMDEERTREVFQGSWLKTDDSGKFDEDGFLYVFGRKKYMILGPGGENVFPEDLEAELIKHPDVRDCAVIGLEHHGRVVIHAVLLSDSGNGDVIIQQTNLNLAPHQQIVSWSLWPEPDFPRSATRKVKKQELIKRITSNVAANSKISVPQTPLTRLIAQTTNIDPGQIHDSTPLVSGLKLDSLLRIELVGRIEEEFGVEIAENQITPETTVGDLHAMIEERKGKTSAVEEYPRWSMAPWCAGTRPTLQKMVFSCLPVLGTQRIKGLENLEGLEGPFIFMANHLSYLDGLYAVFAIPPRYRAKLGIAAARDPLYERFRWIAPFVDLAMNSYPFATTLSENIKPSLEYTGRLLDDGYNVLIFPEGQMNREGSHLQPLKGGAGVLAVEMNAPIVPMGILGTEKILPPDKILPRNRDCVEIRFGKPLTFKTTDNYVKVAKQLEQAIRHLLRD